MGRSIAGKIKINSFADLVGGGQDGAAEVPLSDLHEFKDHPFRVLDDEKMEETVQSIKERGVLVPGIARPDPDGGYELISGHRRKRACELAGLSTMLILIRKYTDDEAVCIMVDSNIQREDILPSEKAKAYRMKFDAMKHQGSKDGGITLNQLAESSGESGKTIQRYIWLTRLSESLMGYVDNKKLHFTSGVELSFLNEKEQKWVEEFIRKGVMISTSQASELKSYSGRKELTKSVMELILVPKKLKARRFVMNAEKLSGYFSDNVTDEEIEDTIFRLLDAWIKDR